MKAVCCVTPHSIRSTAGKFLSRWAQTNPRGRPQHIWTDCNTLVWKTWFILGDPGRVTTHRLHSPAHCYSNQRRRHTIRGDSRELSIGRLNTQTHTCGKISAKILSFHSLRQKKQTNTRHTCRWTLRDRRWSCQANDCSTPGTGGQDRKEEVRYE